MGRNDKDLGAVFVCGVSLVVMLAFALNEMVRNSYRSPSREATWNVREIYDGAVRYFDDNGEFPRSSPLTPSIAHLEAVCDERRSLRTSGWSNNEAWRDLEFEVTARHIYAYQFDSSGEGASAQFTASAFGDLDCDGVFATFVRFGTIREGEVRASAGLYIQNELE